MTPELNTIVCGDCLKWLAEVDEPFADLVFADPPFNIGYKYDVYEDRKAYREYHDWTRQWVAACKRVLKPTGSFWIAIGDDYAAEVRMIGREAGLHLRNWVIWHYTFGQQTKAKFARSHTHLFYFVNDPKQFTFNDRAVRTFSDRQREYNDKRANKLGKLPDDTWNEFPRVCGTFAERKGWHPCQMPESVLARIIRVSSNPGDVVLDPFAGSGTTLAAAKKLSRSFLGIEISAEYKLQIEKRLKAITKTQGLEGERKDWPPEHVEELKSLYLEAGVATANMREKPELFHHFVQLFNWRVELSGGTSGYAAPQIWGKLDDLRKSGQLGRIRMHVIEDRKGVYPLPGSPPIQHGLFEDGGKRNRRAKSRT